MLAPITSAKAWLIQLGGSSGWPLAKIGVRQITERDELTLHFIIPLEPLGYTKTQVFAPPVRILDTADQRNRLRSDRSYLEALHALGYSSVGNTEAQGIGPWITWLVLIAAYLDPSNRPFQHFD